MGLMSRFRGHDSDRSRPGNSSPSHTKGSSSLSSATSNFSHTSLSSSSTEDSGRKTPETAAKQQLAAYPAGYRNSMPSIPTSYTLDSRKRESQGAPGVNPHHRGGSTGHMPRETPVRSAVKNSPQAQQLPQPPQPVQPSQQLYYQANRSNGTLNNPSQNPRYSMPSQPGRARPSIQAPGPAGHTRMLAHARTPSSVSGSGDETQISMSEESASEDGESEVGQTPGRDHPYYEQWKEYYKALERQKKQGYNAQPDSASNQLPMSQAGHMPQTKQTQQVHNNTQQASPRSQKVMYPGMARMSSATANPSTERFYSKVYLAESASTNSLVSNSRRSTIKSSRSASVPSLVNAKFGNHTRAVSVNVASPEIEQPSQQLREDDETNEIDESEKENIANVDFNVQKVPIIDGYGGLEKPMPARLRDLSSTRVASQMSELSIASHISDYAALIFDGSESDEAKEATSETPPDVVATARASESSATSDLSESRIASHQQQEIHNVIAQYESPEKSASVIQHVGDTEVRGSDTDYFTANGPDEALTRNDSTASTNSYSSLQSEKNFVVSNSVRRVATPNLRRHSSSQKKKYAPPIAGPPPPIAPVVQTPNHETAVLQRQLSAFKRQSTGSLPMSDVYMQQIQQQLQQQLQQLQQLQSMQQIHPYPNQYMGYPLATATSPTMGATKWSSDSFVNRNIEEFVQLRAIIAAGNKTFEYRLKWLNMLITATNNKVFAYVNIKGEAIPSELVTENKQYFIRSCVNHLQKLLKELSRNERKEMKKLYAEACFIQGCLYSNAYLERFGQDFNYELDVAEAERFFHLCLETDPSYFRAYYELGELYEAQQDEVQFDRALENYTESAQMGYNRAIYKMALIHLLVPKVRSTRFFAHFRKLADIDMDSTDVQLSGADRDELEEIVGLAQYQLGKIYEGVYPGDLSVDSEFVQASLQLAPVTYSKSLSYYNKAAKNACVHAQVRLGRIYEDAELGRAHNPKKSVQWYMRASSSPLKYKRHPEAMLGLSRWFLNGTNGLSKYIVDPDVDAAVQWCERACREFAYPEAYYEMGLLVENGYAAGDPRMWYEQAWNAGHVAAGEMLGMGMEPPTDMAESTFTAEQ